MTAFRVRWPDYDDEWIEIDAYDAEQAAELAAANICERDNECYSSFEDDGETLIVEERPGEWRWFKVSVEFSPVFRARGEHDGG